MNSYYPEVMILMELRTHPLKIKRSITMLDFDGFVISENTDYSGGIMIAWKQGVWIILAL